MQFEASQRKCSACGETGHNARTCKSKTVPFSTGGFWNEKSFDGLEQLGLPLVDKAHVAMISKVIDGEVLKEPNARVRIPNITWKEEPITMTWGELDEKCKTQNLVSIGESTYSGAYLRGALAYLPKNTVLTLYTGYHYPLKATFEYGGEEWIFFLAPRVENYYAESDSYGEYTLPFVGGQRERLEDKIASQLVMLQRVALNKGNDDYLHDIFKYGYEEPLRKMTDGELLRKNKEVEMDIDSIYGAETFDAEIYDGTVPMIKTAVASAKKSLNDLEKEFDVVLAPRLQTRARKLTKKIGGNLRFLESVAENSFYAESFNAEKDPLWLDKVKHQHYKDMIAHLENQSDLSEMDRVKLQHYKDMVKNDESLDMKNAQGSNMEYECQVCGEPADYNFQDATIRWKIVNDEFSGNPKVSEYAGQEQNDFYCQEHADEMETGEFYAESLKFKEWADQEMMTHGGRESFQDWLDDEVSSHGNTSLEDWGEHEIASHEARYEAENVLSMKNLGAVAVGGALGIALVGLFTGKNLLTDMTSKLSKASEAKKDCHSCNTNGSVRKNQTQVLSSEYSVGQINPVEVEGQQDIHGAEGVNNPRFAPSPTPAPHRAKSSKWL